MDEWWCLHRDSNAEYRRCSNVAMSRHCRHMSWNTSAPMCTAAATCVEMRAVEMYGHKHIYIHINEYIYKTRLNVVEAAWKTRRGDCTCTRHTGAGAKY